jgi:hypothetical protein
MESRERKPEYFTFSNDLLLSQPITVRYPILLLINASARPSIFV